MPVGTAGDNATALGAIGTAWKGRSGAPTPPTDALEGTIVSYVGDGNAVLTAFSIPHGLKNAAGNGIAPSGYALTPRNAVSAAAHWVSSVTTTNVIVTFTAAPASATGNVTFMLAAYK